MNFKKLLVMVAAATLSVSFIITILFNACTNNFNNDTNKHNNDEVIVNMISSANLAYIVIRDQDFSAISIFLLLFLFVHFY